MFKSFLKNNTLKMKDTVLLGATDTCKKCLVYDGKHNQIRYVESHILLDKLLAGKVFNTTEKLSHANVSKERLKTAWKKYQEGKPLGYYVGKYKGEYLYMLVNSEEDTVEFKKIPYIQIVEEVHSQDIYWLNLKVLKALNSNVLTGVKGSLD